jgi:hypothetical protein
MNREFHLHIEMEAEHLMRGVTADEARRQARVAFGGVERHKQALRDGRGLAWLGGLALANTFLIMLLVLVSANVALLMFARAATRETEIAVRSALGAGRARIVMQLFVEALVLAGLAIAVGLSAARVGLGSLLAMFEADRGRSLPFWMGNTLTPTTVIMPAR